MDINITNRPTTEYRFKWLVVCQSKRVKNRAVVPPHARTPQRKTKIVFRAGFSDSIDSETTSVDSDEQVRFGCESFHSRISVANISNEVGSVK